MKKVLALFIVMILLLCGTTTAFAAELNISNISQDALFASKETCTSVTKNLNIEQIKQFFDEEVSLDMQHLVPVYIPTGDSSDNTLQSMLEATNTYNTLVFSKDEKVLGTATLECYETMWVVGTFCEGYDMLGEIGNLTGKANQTFYYIDNPYANEQALLIVGRNTETYRSLSSSNGTVNASEIVDAINEARQLNGILADGIGGNTNNAVLTPYIISSFIILTLAILTSVFILRKKARQ